MAAKSKLTTFDIAIVPLFPKNLVTLLTCRKRTQAIARLRMREASTMKMEYWSVSMSRVVSTAGPTTNGVPKGTTPMVSTVGKVRSSTILPVARSLIDKTRRIRPPATRKSATSMPRNVKMKAETDCVVMVINANLLNQADASLQVKFLKEFYLNKTLQLVDANLKLIQMGL